ncbi:MAG TPA: dTDP-4-dehydrorhamnose reductase, partial [Flavisolibacter sp.]|nr:dTDP-4-dehydrorhamnose reductase [Flavisolibacter sp.]
DKAESEQEQAMQINGLAVGALAEACSNHDVKFIHLSTDYVFDGTHQQPVNEDTFPAPVNFYGESKFAGELLTLQTNPDSIIIRTSWVYSFYGKNFVKTMMRLMAEKESISVVSDQWGSPTYAADLAQAILQIIGSGNWQAGIYHFSNDGVINWAQFAKEIAEKIGSTCVVNPIPTSAYPTPAKRPLYSVMDKTRIQEQFGINLKPWRESLTKCLQKLQSSAVSQ